VAADDGSLVSGLKTLLPTLLKPLQDELNRLALEIRGQSEVAEALAGPPPICAFRKLADWCA
jgi:hypothetical protein